jgi:hypothetical protein
VRRAHGRSGTELQLAAGQAAGERRFEQLVERERPACCRDAEQRRAQAPAQQQDDHENGQKNRGLSFGVE